MTQYVTDSRNVATVPNFSPAAGDYIIPNTDTVTSNFVLQANNGAWVTIPVTEYQLFPASGYIAQRATDFVTGAGVDWSAYSAYRVHTSYAMVSGARTTLTADAALTFAEDETGYSPLGQVGEMNGEALRNAITNYLVAGGGDVTADEQGITLVTGTNNVNRVKWMDGNTLAGWMQVSASPYIMSFGIDATSGQKALFTMPVNMPNVVTLLAGLMLQLQDVSLSNGNNNDVSMAGMIHVRIAGPTAAFAITGIAAPSDAALLFVVNSTTQQMTVKHQNTGSSAENRIVCNDAGTDVLCKHAILIYDTTGSRWRLMGFS